MVTSKEVFSKRKEGALDEAYQMATELVSRPGADDWDYKALAWCCIDLIKRDSNAGNPRAIEEYLAHLEKVVSNQMKAMRAMLELLAQKGVLTREEFLAKLKGKPE